MSWPQSPRRLITVAAAVLVSLLALGVVGCAALPRRMFLSARQADYFATRPELSPRVARAMEDGHILLGMDTTQVWVVLGDPVRKSRFVRAEVEIWLYRATSLRQDHFKLGPDLMRLIFLKNQLVIIEPM